MTTRKMTTSPYSIDLREKVISFLKAGNSQKEAARVFELSPVTVNKWHVRYKNEGHCNPRKRIGASPGINTDEFILYVKDNPNAKASEIGSKFGMSASGARYWLGLLKFSYKKKPSPMWRQISRKEESI